MDQEREIVYEDRAVAEAAQDSNDSPSDDEPDNRPVGIISPTPNINENNIHNNINNNDDALSDASTQHNAAENHSNHASDVESLPLFHDIIPDDESIIYPRVEPRPPPPVQRRRVFRRHQPYRPREPTVNRHGVAEWQEVIPNCYRAIIGGEGQSILVVDSWPLYETTRARFFDVVNFFSNFSGVVPANYGECFHITTSRFSIREMETLFNLFLTQRMFLS